jgi:hypothetical protein
MGFDYQGDAADSMVSKDFSAESGILVSRS